MIISLSTINKEHLYKSWLKVFNYGFLFGLAYNCVYLHWYLNLAPLDWLGFNAWQGQLLAIAAWLIVASHQALLVAIFSVLCKLLLNVLSKTNASNILQIFLVPLLWVIVINKLGNARDLTGVPWSMLEYTQYKQLPLIQIADIVGSIGIGFLIVMINAFIAQVVEAMLIGRNESKPALDKSLISAHAPALSLCMSFLVAANFYGHYVLASPQTEPKETVSIVQPNINIEMEKSKRQCTLSELITHQLQLASKCPPGLCVWTESSLPTRISEDKDLQRLLISFAQSKKLSLIVGTIDSDNADYYNAAWATSSSGRSSKQMYHKRYLVPFGEYTPQFVRNWPDWILCLTNTPAGTGYSSGKEPALLNINEKLIAPLICFEVISPELAAASVRAGGQLLVNINDLAWFHESIIGEQMIACAVFRAIENRRYFIFAANTGPSAVISSTGKINASIGQDKTTDLIDKFNYLSKLTLFTRYFML